jgi:hypothetical protein
MYTTESPNQKLNKEINIQMNTLKVTNWLGFSLLCLAILSAPLAQLGLQTAQNLQDRSSQLELTQEDGEQIDMIDSPHQLVNAAPTDGASAPASPVQFSSISAVLPAGHVKTLDPIGAGRIPTLHILADGEYDYVPAGGIAGINPTNGSARIQAGGIAAIDPTNGSVRIQAGGITAIDPTNGSVRIQAGGIAAVDPTNGSARIQAGGIAGIDPTNGSVRIQAGTTGSNKDDVNSYVLSTAIKDRPKHRSK